MKKRFLALGLATGAMVFMTACGDETTNTDIIKASSADNVDSLPKCDNSYEGMLATIPSKGQILVCNKGSWQNVAKTIQTSTDSSGNSTNESGCTAKTLEDKSGVTIICSGEKIATLKNGAKGPDGDTGKQGGQGEQGDPGSNGTGSSGKDLKLDETDCSVTYVGFDITLYKCGDEEYLESLNGSKANLKTWNGLNTETVIKNKAGTVISSYFSMSSFESATGNSDGKFLWDGDSVWIDDDANVTADRLKKDFAIRAQAKLTVESGATKYVSFPVEPMVGVYMQFASMSVHSLGGLCLTYEAKQKMELIAVHNIGLEVARVPLNASSKVTTVNILPGDFKADSADAKVAGILGDALAIIIKAVGSLEAGEYENEFAIYEIGAYGRCSGPRFEDIEAWAKTVKKGTGKLVDNRTDPAITYNTVTIGNQTWMAENLRVPYDAKTAGADGVAGTSDDEPMILCPATEEETVAKGCLYRWSAVMDSVGLYNDDSVYQDENGIDVALKHCGYDKSCALTAPVKGICPDGWHVPNMAELNELWNTAIFDKSLNSTTLLRGLAVGDEGKWNWLGFSLVPTGFSNDNLSSYSTYVTNTYLWSSDQSSATNARYKYTNFPSITNSESNGETKSRGFSVRCIQDKAKE